MEVTTTEAAKRAIKAVLGDETDETKSEHRTIQRMEEYSNSWIKASIHVVSSAAENQYMQQSCLGAELMKFLKVIAC